MSLTAYFLHENAPHDTEVFSVRMREAISDPFDCWVEIGSVDPDLDVESMLWSTAAVQIGDSRFDPSDLAHWRYVHGAIEQAAYVGPLGPRHLYRFRLRPSIHGLAYRFRTRIFQDSTVLDIARRVLEEAGLDLASFEFDVEPGQPREYVTQWKESELAFIERWMQELGVRYWFEHTEVEHTMRLSDKATVHEPIEEPSDLFVEPRPDTWFDAGGDAIHTVRYLTHFGYDRFASRDWNFEFPQGAREAERDDGPQERYEYPGGYGINEEGDALAQVRIEELRTSQIQLMGRSGCRRLTAGKKFLLQGMRPDALVGEYLVTALEYEVRRSGDDITSDTFTYDSTFTAIPASVPYRPARRIPRPRVAGKESAVVTSPPGEEIHVDEHGRIKVHFYWDREQPVDDTASCWVRTQQQNTAGAMFLPRVGWEVDIGFLHGDPDRPVMLQKLYNEEEQPPYSLPGNLMQSSLRTSSSPGGGGTNEIRLNDANGKQEFFSHAQRDFSNAVGVDASTTVGVNAQTQVKANAAYKVVGAESVTIGGNQSVNAVGKIAIQCAASQTITVGGLDDWSVTSLHTVTTHGSRTDTIGGLLNVLAATGIADDFNASHSLTVGAAYALTSAGPISETVAGGKTEAVGAAKLEIISKSKSEDIKVGKILTSGAVKIDAGTDVALGAGAALAIKTGGAYSTKCGGDFGISGAAVTMKLSSLEMKAGGSVIKASSGDITLDASNLGGEGVKILLKGDVDYV